ncbi:hypothetical protein NDU88_000850 [Pleurodeles waltl]|uniref:SGNH hydrolase-type esterase domain-containing protein n=2 Tax=Pleurodeles waltl TaxID=8319 RepID=A0AAV7WKU4_PLEWA|nr:hypothetical protein NDU88_000850 [Pleurodeles waltl]
MFSEKRKQLEALSANAPHLSITCLSSYKPTTAASLASDSPNPKTSQFLGASPIAVKWMKSKPILDRIIRVTPLPRYDAMDLCKFLKPVGTVLDTLLLFRENQGYFEMDWTEDSDKYEEPTHKKPRLDSRADNNGQGGGFAGGDAAANEMNPALDSNGKATGVCGKNLQQFVVWVFGDSIITQAADRFKKQKETNQISTNEKISFCWFGYENLRLDELREKVLEQKRLAQVPPDAFILHLGGNDLVHLEGQRVKEGLTSLHSWLSALFPDCLIAWSEILPRLFWASGVSTNAMNLVARGINNELASLPPDKSFKSVLRHPKLTKSSPSYFHPEENLLSESGIDIFIESLIAFVDAMPLPS